ncbi:MAG: hydantoinase/oxoprolinase family protein, partial [Myxococcales bacterium]|nr:hydantoinase/oxoprolinase family protein [Myxococcales bacterium]
MPATPETLPDPERLIVAVDTGGTFTDAVGRRGDRVAVAKVPSTPADPAAAVLDAVRRVAAALGGDADELVHGTTVATNALLEERGAETWLVVDAGFEDLLAIGRQTRPELYALHVAPRESLVPRPLTVGVRGRIDASGAAVEPVDLGALHAAIDAMDARPRSWAVCLLHAGVDAAREREIRDVILARCPDDRVTLSSEVSAEPREVERATTAVASAMVQPVLATYLARLEPAAASVCVMSSAGGRLSLVEAAARPVTTATSGPAGGALAAQEIARAVVAREPRLRGVVTFDMGGTSTDVALCVGAVPMRRESRVGRFSLSVSALDIHTVGAGGGSVARVDAGGGLRVGPRSAGADP